jgi:hypothetical protein
MKNKSHLSGFVKIFLDDVGEEVGGMSGALWLLPPIYDFCIIFVVKRMGAEYMEGVVIRSKNELVAI